ncbi:DNA polymerase III subunit delta' [Roseateles sp. DB2]|uniref:DNA polymerase III subunit delta' n=1 Tax=Roseateles sp. DB2 TaxID=3453717 RepID=UPI003EEF843A
MVSIKEDGALALPWLDRPLIHALQQARSHALLVQGPEGVGQLEMALALAQSWLCESPLSTGLACGRCASCHLFQSRSHPDFMLLVPDAWRDALGLEADEAEVAKDGEGKVSKSKPSREIKVDAVRAMLGFAQVTAARGRAKVVVLFPAESLNTVAANALLKTLEEPAGLLRFVLASSAPESLLPTIRSRCQPVPLGLPPRDQALAWLAGRGVASPEVLLDACGGRPQQALQWSEDGVAAKSWLELPRRIARNEATALSDWPVPRAIEAMQRLATDLIRTAHGAPPAYFPRDALPAPRNPDAMQEWARVLKEAARHAEHPVNAPLLLESLVGQGQRLMRVSVRKDA